MLTADYIDYLRTVRRYSPRTQDIYAAVLDSFAAFALEGDATDETLLAALTPTTLRNYEVHLLDERQEDPKTVNLHLSVLSGFCKFLLRKGLIPSNPVRLISRPKTAKRLPAFYREESMQSYFEDTARVIDEKMLTFQRALPASDPDAIQLYESRLRRLIVSLLYSTGIRRSELLTLTVGSVDFGRHTLSVHGKGDKMREIPLVAGLCEEISLYLYP